MSGGRTMISIGYKYNAQNVLYLIFTGNAERTQAVIPYLYNYPDQFTNVSILPISRPLVVSNFFGSVNEVDSHNKSRQSYLVLVKFWVTQCSWIQLCSTIDMVTIITNCLNCFVVGLIETNMKN